jgi:hypothetical protein
MNVEIGAEAVLFPEKECINGIFVAVCSGNICLLTTNIETKNYAPDRPSFSVNFIRLQPEKTLLHY